MLSFRILIFPQYCLISPLLSHSLFVVLSHRPSPSSSLLDQFPCGCLCLPPSLSPVHSHSFHFFLRFEVRFSSYRRRINSSRERDDLVNGAWSDFHGTHTEIVDLVLLDKTHGRVAFCRNLTWNSFNERQLRIDMIAACWATIHCFNLHKFFSGVMSLGLRAGESLRSLF